MSTKKILRSDEEATAGEGGVTEVKRRRGIVKNGGARVLNRVTSSDKRRTLKFGRWRRSPYLTE